jgi:hypothetical protein
MAWKSVTTTATDIKKTPNKPYEGTYQGSTDIKTKIGDQKIYNFVDDEGVPFGVYGFTNLNRAMETVQPGSVIRLTYLGTKNLQTKFGMKDVHQVKVEVHVEDGKELPEDNLEDVFGPTTKK